MLKSIVNFQEDSFLGKLDIPLQSLEDPTKTQSEEWQVPFSFSRGSHFSMGNPISLRRCDLQKRSDKSHVAGQLHVKLYFARFDQNDTITAQDYHSLYDILAKKVGAASKLHPELVDKGRVFLEEFGKRYGVRGLYRLVK